MKAILSMSSVKEFIKMIKEHKVTKKFESIICGFKPIALRDDGCSKTIVLTIRPTVQFTMRYTYVKSIYVSPTLAILIKITMETQHSTMTCQRLETSFTLLPIHLLPHKIYYATLSITIRNKLLKPII